MTSYRGGADDGRFGLVITCVCGLSQFFKSRLTYLAIKRKIHQTSLVNVQV